MMDTTMSHHVSFGLLVLAIHVDTGVAQTLSPVPSPTIQPSQSDDSDDNNGLAFWIYILIGAGGLLIASILFSCWYCRRGNKRLLVENDIEGGPARRKYFGKGRIPDFDPSSEMMFDGPFSGNVKNNPIRQSTTSNNSNITARTPSDLNRNRSSFDTDRSFKREITFNRNKSQPLHQQPSSTDTDYEAASIPVVVNQGNGVLKVEAKLEKGEVLGIETKPREHLRGIVISDIVENSAADRWQVFGPGDVMLSINGRDVLNASHEAVQLALSVCGQNVVLEVLTASSARKQRQPSTQKRKVAAPPPAAVHPSDGNESPALSRKTLNSSSTSGVHQAPSLKRQHTKTEKDLLEVDNDAFKRQTTREYPDGTPSGASRNQADQVELMRFETTVIHQPTTLTINRSDGNHEAETDDSPSKIKANVNQFFSDPKVDGPHPLLSGNAPPYVHPPVDSVKGSKRPKDRAPPPAPDGVEPVSPQQFDTSKFHLQLPGTGGDGKMRANDTQNRNEAGTYKRKRTRTIKKEAGKLLVRLKQLTDGADTPDDLPEYNTVRTALIEEFGKEFFDNQEAYVRSWLTQIGMSKFDETSSSDPSDGELRTISRRGNRPKSFAGAKLDEMFKKKNERTASGWFKEITAAGKKRKRYCEMNGAVIKLSEKVRKALVLRDSVTVDSKTSIQRHGYELFIINPDDRITLQAESEQACIEWYTQLRATYIELCEDIDLEAFQTQMDDPPPEPATKPKPTGGITIGGLENSGGGGGSGGGDANPAASKLNKASSSSPVKEEEQKNEPEPPKVELTEEEKAEKRAKARAALAEKRAAAKAARAANYDNELKAIFAWIDALDEDTF